MNSSLYLIQSSSSATQSVLAKLKQIYDQQDQVIFFGEALSMLTQADLDYFAQCYCLESEQVLLDLNLIPSFTLLNSTQFADLVLQFERCISLK
ncbi:MULTISPECIES: hypothetical protein [unclassified Acinetobacter]|uniref:hypothetical protein n=1 Tax=unclassified Acinetobacter TaxID=196816 RepID=UPI00190E5A83|nr:MULTISPECIES: hypothetical protein [unclassified Acinetobacter]MBK0063306.1 hypothetical protein [Acinetobacter sp. S55]MBK0066782.1 hypothetical protein [Acinetobacter sp. S54]